MPLSRLFRSRISLRSHLLALVLVTLVPVLIFCGVLVFALTQHERGTVEQGSRETARALAVAVDQQLEGAMAALSAIATRASRRSSSTTCSTSRGSSRTSCASSSGPSSSGP